MSPATLVNYITRAEPCQDRRVLCHLNFKSGLFEAEKWTEARHFETSLMSVLGAYWQSIHVLDKGVTVLLDQMDEVSHLLIVHVFLV